MINEPKVSVIIPFYSGVDWLEEAVQSVLDQTYSNFEIFVVNDGSNENITSFLAKYGNKIIYILQQNSGPGAARNKGLQLATGKYIAFLDSDDLWKPEKTVNQIDLMERTGAIWSHTNFEYFFNGTTKYTKCPTIKYRGNLTWLSLVSVIVATPTLIIRKDFFDQNPNLRYGEHMRYGQDSLLYLQIGWNYPIEHLNEYVVLVRKRGGQRGVAAGQRARVRIRVRHQIWNFIKTDKTQYNFDRHINFWVRNIYRYYSICDNLISSFEGEKGIEGRRYEFLSKLLCLPIYVLEKLYKKYIVITKFNKDYA